MNKKLFGAVTFALAFAACTNENELVVSTGVDAQLANRPVIGKVEISTNPETRAVVEDGKWGKLSYVSGDAIGAALIDAPNLVKTYPGELDSEDALYADWNDVEWSYVEYVNAIRKDKNGNKANNGMLFTDVKGDPSKFYTVTGDMIHTNYGYAYNGTSWTSEASLVEGHYMFYFPYNPKHTSRLPINLAIPATQDCTDGNSAIDAFYDGEAPVAVDVQFLQMPADGKKLSATATPKHLYAFPQITIVNDFNGYLYDMKKAVGGQTVSQEESAKATAKAVAKKTMTIDKIEFFYVPTADEVKLWQTAKLDAKLLHDEIEDGEWANGTNKFENVSSTHDVLASTEATFTAGVKPHLNDASTAAAYGNQQVITCNVNKTLENGEEYVFNAIMPAENYGKGLKARVYVTIGDKQYVLLKSTNTLYYNDGNPDKGINYIKATAFEGAFSFNAKNVQLVRGERYPIIEYKVDSEGTATVKSSAGSIMTISMAGMAAFEVGEFEADDIVTDYCGFTTNEEFITAIEDYTRGTSLQEVSNVGTSLAEHKVAFNNNHTIVLNSELVNAIYTNVNYEEENVLYHLNLTETNLPIGNDVNVAKVGSYYELTATTGKQYTIKVWYTGSVINTDGGALTSGINEISATCTLAKKNGDAGLGVVYLKENVTYNIGNAANSFRINLEKGTLKVNNACGALINTSNGTSVEIEENGSLTNANNNFAETTTITNNFLKTISGNLNGNTVSATLTEWPTSIPAASKVNDVTINASGTITLEQADFNVFSVANTTVKLGADFEAIRSNADVNLTTTNIKSLTGTFATCKWIGGSNGNIVVTSSNNHTIAGISEGNACSINTITE